MRLVWCSAGGSALCPVCALVDCTFLTALACLFGPCPQCPEAEGALGRFYTEFSASLVIAFWRSCFPHRLLLFSVLSLQTAIAALLQPLSFLPVWVNQSLPEYNRRSFLLAQLLCVLPSAVAPARSECCPLRWRHAAAGCPY